MDQPRTLKPAILTSADPARDEDGQFPSAPVLRALKRDELTCLEPSAPQTPEFIAAWDRLAASAAQPNPFYESWYLLPSLHALDPQGEVEILVLQAGDEMLGLMPVRRERSYYGHRLPHWRNWVHANCFLGAPLVMPGFEQVFWRAVLDWVDAATASQLFLHLSQCPADGPLHGTLRQELATQNRPAATVMQEDRAMLASDLAPEPYLEASLSTKKRKELRRQHRRLQDMGDLQFARSRGGTEIAPWAAEFLALEQRGWKGKAGSSLASDPATEAMFRQALEGAAQRGKLERLTLRLDGQPIAMLANFITAPGAYSYKTAFDEGFSRFSPGVLLQRENLALLEQDDIEWVDSCASKDHPMIDHFWRERRAIARHSIAIGGTLRQTAFMLLSRIETGSAPKGIS